MNFLADESCAGPVIRALRGAGHDVVAIAEVARGATDEQVLERAFNENRVLITEDQDFGELSVCARSVVSWRDSGQGFIAARVSLSPRPRLRR